MDAQQVPLDLDSPAFRRCAKGGEIKPILEFALQSITTGQRQSYCRACHAAYRRQHYERNRGRYNANVNAQMARRRAENRARIHAYLLEHPCVDCGEKDPLVLEFDHRESSEKYRAISVLANHSPWSRVAAEIAKCDVRCRNCHRRRTAIQFSWSRARAR